MNIDDLLFRIFSILGVLAVFGMVVLLWFFVYAVLTGQVS